ncbi:MAG: ribonuclease III [bacterium]
MSKNITSDEKEKFEELEKILGVKFNDTVLLKSALIHRSFLNEVKNTEFENNERLEFLGDAVLELLTSDFLFKKLPDRLEGDLTSFRAALVKTDSLAEISTKLGIGKYIYMSRGEETTGGRNRTYVLANTFEAILGAIYLDSGLETVNSFLLRELYGKTDAIVASRSDIDPKSRLQEISQLTFKSTPYYELKDEEGPDHSKVFTMCVKIDNKVYGSGKGKSKQDAEQSAALEALKVLQKP